MCYNRKVLDLECVRSGMCYNRNVLELECEGNRSVFKEEFVRIAIC